MIGGRKRTIWGLMNRVAFCQMEKGGGFKECEEIDLRDLSLTYMLLLKNSTSKIFQKVAAYKNKIHMRTSLAALPSFMVSSVLCRAVQALINYL